MSTKNEIVSVGELRPNQLIYMFGIGSMVDLPHLSVLVMGLDFWKIKHCQELQEERLLAAIRTQLGPQVKHLYLPPSEKEESQIFKR